MSNDTLPERLTEWDADSLRPDIAKEIARRYNAFPAMLEALLDAASMLNTVAVCGTHSCADCREASATRRDSIRAAITQAEGK
jgi:hypothetical protein